MKDNLYKLPSREDNSAPIPHPGMLCWGSCQCDGCMEPTDAKHTRYKLESLGPPTGGTHYSPRITPLEMPGSITVEFQPCFLSSRFPCTQDSTLLCVSSKQNASKAPNRAPCQFRHESNSWVDCARDGQALVIPGITKGSFVGSGLQPTACRWPDVL